MPATTFIRCALLAFLLPVGIARSEEAKAPAPAKIEFRWLEDRAIVNVTEPKGIRTTCGDELSYPHLAAVLTNKHIASATLTKHDFSANGLPGNQFMITFQLTDAARKILGEELGRVRSRELAVYVDGHYWGTTYVRKDNLAGLAPHCGFLTSEAEAKRIVASVK